ncbi:MAG: hypothetical protein QOI62_284 [Solirubrobacteraceae bacterium]|nr:hypothetical protein [Solirubrobacteraceae bacterium]MEA2357024.1 hypothetical protein [Solirubrobacteraceae bacterium]
MRIMRPVLDATPDLRSAGPRLATGETLDLRELIQPGDTVVFGQGTSEPQTLTEALVAQRADLGAVTVFLGSTFAGTFQPEHADALRFIGMGGVTGNAALARAGVLDVMPCHVSTVPDLIASGRLGADVVFVHVSGPGADGRYSVGMVADYIQTAVAHARVVVAECNDQMPYTLGDTLLDPDQIDVLIHTSRPPLMVTPQPASATSTAIAETIAGIVPDGAVLQIGIGAIPDALTSALVSHRDLGIHSGVIGDGVVDLIEAGVVTNALKGRDVGVTVTGALFGTERLYRFADDNPAIELRSLAYTHSQAVLSGFERLHAVNAALEVDLTGQVNSETLRGNHVGAVGGQVDFVRGAMRSPGGRSIIALPSATKDGRTPRIVSRLTDGVTTTARSDADLVVTEHGCADLRGVPLSERARRLIAIAHPAWRDELERAAVGLC